MERDQPSKPLIEVHESAEDVRIYSTSQIGKDWAMNIMQGITRHPGVEDVYVHHDGPTLRFQVTVSGPQHWDQNVDPHCRSMIEMAAAYQAPIA